MNKRMTAAAHAELADAIRPRCTAAPAKEKVKILEGFLFMNEVASNILGEAAGNKIT